MKMSYSAFSVRALLSLGVAAAFTMLAFGAERNPTPPPVEVRISGTLDGEVEIKAAGQAFKLEPGQSRQVRLAEGVDFELSRGMAQGGVSWAVNQGELRLGWAGFSGVTTVAEAGQRGRAIWGLRRNQAYLQIENNATTGQLTVTANGQPSVGVGPGAMIEAVPGAQPDTFVLSRPQRNGDGQVVRVTLEATSEQGLAARVGNQMAASVKTLKAAGNKPATNSWGSISLGADGASLVIGATGQEVALEAAGYNGWQVRIPADNQAHVSLNPVARLIDLGASTTNSKPLAVELFDGTTAELAAGSRLRYDVFVDQSHALTGTGAVTIRRAGAGGIKAGADGLPVTGGPSVVVRDAAGNRKTEQLTPATGLRITGALGGVLEVVAADQAFKLEPGQSRRVQLANGTDFELTQPNSRPAVELHVVKGDVRIEVAPMAGVKALAGTLDHLLLTWMGTDGLQVENLSANGRAMVVAQGHQPLLVGPGGVLLARGEAGGHGLHWFRQGPVEGATNIQLESDPAGGWRALVNGEAGITGPALRQAGTNGVRNSWGSLALARDNRGLVFEAGSTTLFLGIKGFDGWQVVLPPGNIVTLQVDVEHGLIDTATGARNLQKTAVNVLEGATVQMGPASSLRYDRFLDRSYALTGKGELLAVSTGRAQNVALGEEGMPMTGGPLLSKDIRSVPTTEIIVAGVLGGELEVRHGDQSFALAPGQSRRIVGANGTDIELTQGQAQAGLNWTVTKGDARINVALAGGLRTITGTGQRGRLVWDQREGGGRLQVENNSPRGSLTVVATGRKPEVIEPGAMVQVVPGATAGTHEFVWQRRGPAAGGVVVRLETGGAEGMTAKVGDQVVASVKSARESGKPLATEWGSIGLGGDGQGLALGAAGQAVTILVEGFGGWQALLPAGNKLQATADPGLQLIDVRTPADNMRDVQLSFGDGAVAQMGVGARLRYDVYRNDSYALTGAGKIAVRRLDGSEISLGASGVPVTGGPEVVSRDGAGKGKTEQLAPTSELKVNGALGGVLELQVAGQAFKLEPGQSWRVQLTNGTDFELTQGLSQPSLTWTVRKGDVRVSVESLGGVKAITETGQRGRLVWEKTEGGKPGFQVENNSVGGQVVVLMDGQDPVRVSGGGILRATGEARGYSVKWQRAGLAENAVSLRLETDPAGGQRVLVGGVVVASGEAIRQAGGQPVAGDWGGASLGPDGRSLVLRSAGERALVVEVGGFGDWQTIIPAGNQAGFATDYVQGLVNVRATSKSDQPLLMIFDDGATATLGSGSALRYDFFKDQSYVLTGGGKIEVKQADGTETRLLANSVPVAGGLLAFTQTPSGPKGERQVPTLEVKVNGVMGGELDLKIGDQEYKLEPGKSQRAQFPNGTDIELTAGLSQAGLSWTVTKGDARVSVETMNGVKAITETGQRGRLIWERREAGGALRVENTSVGGKLVVVVPGQNAMAVEPGGILQVNPGRNPQENYFVGWAKRGSSATGVDLRLEPNKNDGLQAKVGDAVVTSTALLRQGDGQAVVTEWGTIKLGENRNSLTITSDSDDVTVSVTGFNGWQAQVPTGNQATIDVIDARKLIDVSTPGGNSQNLVLMFPDGASAQMGATSTLRYDYFKNQTYFVVGTGKVSVTTADGVVVPVTATSRVKGGLVAEVPDPKTGGKRLERLTPLTEVKITGSVGGELLVKVGDQVIRLPASGPEFIRLDNGSILEVMQNQALGNLSWRVEKGDFKISFEGLTGWKAEVITGQVGSFSWDRDNKLIDVRNSTLDSGVVVTLPNKAVVLVTAGSSFQVLMIDSETFATAAAGGPVVVINPVTGLVIDLERSNFLFKSGVAYQGNQAVGAVVSPSPASVLTLNWQDGGLRVSGVSTSIKLDPGSEQVFRTGNGEELRMSLDDKGGVSFQAVTGGFAFKPDSSKGWVIEISEGDAVSVSSNPRRGTIIAQPGAGNQNPIRITTSEGVSPIEGKDTTVTLISGQGRGGPGGVSGGGMVVSEGAGAGIDVPDSGTIRDTPVLNPTSSLDVSRLNQPPVSVFR